MVVLKINRIKNSFNEGIYKKIGNKYTIENR